MAYFDSYNVQYSDDRKTLVKCPQELTGLYTILDGTEIIAKSAFSDCAKISELTIPSSLSIVEDSAFKGCKAIGSIRFNGTLIMWLKIVWKSFIEAGHSLYVRDELVTDVAIPVSVKEIGKYAFYYCNSIKSVTFHAGIKKIGNGAFNKSTLSGSIVLPEGVEILEPYSFFNCSISSVWLPSTLTTIGFGSFSACYKLSQFNISPDNQNYEVIDGRCLVKLPHDTVWPAGINLPVTHHERTLVAFARVGVANYTLPSEIQELMSEVFCFSSLPIGGLHVRHELRSISSDAFRSATGKLYIPAPHASFYKDSTPKLPESLTIIEEFSNLLAFKEGHNAIRAIVDNPFRILGVCANSSQKEITANARKIKRYLEVGKTTDFPFDMVELLPPVVRTAESVDNALSQLSVANEKLKASLYWFSVEDELDEMALSHLQKSNSEKALDILSKRESWSHSINKAVAHLILGNFEEAAESYSEFVHGGDCYYVDLSKSTCGDDFEIDESDVMKLQLDALAEDVNIESLRALYSGASVYEEDYDYFDAALRESYNSQLNREIQKAKSVDSEDSESSRIASEDLVNGTFDILRDYRSHYGEDDPEYCLVAGKVAEQILQCAINYYNNSLEKYACEEAIKLAELALSVAKGQAKIERINTNLKTLRDVQSRLAPREVEAEDDAITALISKYEDMVDTIDCAMEFLRSCAPHIVTIKEFYERKKYSKDKDRIKSYMDLVSTAVVNLALHKTIEDVNKSIKLGFAARDKIKSAWNITLNLAKFPMQDDFQTKRYKPNRETLSKLMSQVALKTFLVPYDSIDMRTENEVWLSCKTLENYQYYVKQFPQGVHVSDARKRISELLDKKEDEFWQKCRLSNQFDDYCSEYPLGRYVAEAKRLKQEWLNKLDDDAFSVCSFAYDFIQYIANYPNGRHTEQAEYMRDQKIAEETAQWELCTSTKDIEKYIQDFPYGIFVEKATTKLSHINSQRKRLILLIIAEVVTIIILSAHILFDKTNFVLVCATAFIAGLLGLVFYIGKEK